MSEQITSVKQWLDSEQSRVRSYTFNELVEFAEFIQEYEREQCAKVCGRLAAKHFEGSYADECAMAIRARGNE